MEGGLDSRASGCQHGESWLSECPDCIIVHIPTIQLSTDIKYSMLSHVRPLKEFTVKKEELRQNSLHGDLNISS